VALLGRARRSTTPLDVLLLASNPGLALVASRCLWDADLSFQLLATGRYPSVSTMRNCRGAVRIDAADLRTDAPHLVAQLRRAVDLSPTTVIVPAGLPATLFLARNAAAFPQSNLFPVSSPEVIEELDDKWRFGQLLGRLYQPHPATELVHSLDEARALSFEGRTVLKPLAAEGSMGVRICDTREELLRAVERVSTAGLLPVIVQEFVPGDDMAVLVMANRGDVVGSRVQKHEADGGLAFPDRPDAVEMARAVVNDTDAHGVFCFDLRRDDRNDHLFMTECNPRLYATSHKSGYTGMNPVALGVELARTRLVAVPADVGSLVAPPLRTLAHVLRRQPVNAPSRRAMDAELRNPLSSTLRLAEQRLPALADRFRGEAVGGWAAFDEAEGRHSAW
jgi:hypothetical protein